MGWNHLSIPQTAMVHSLKFGNGLRHFIPHYTGHVTIYSWNDASCPALAEGVPCLNFSPHIIYQLKFDGVFTVELGYFVAIKNAYRYNINSFHDIITTTIHSNEMIKWNIGKLEMESVIRIANKWHQYLSICTLFRNFKYKCLLEALMIYHFSIR